MNNDSHSSCQSLSKLAYVTMATTSLSITKSESSWADSLFLRRTADRTGGGVWLEFGCCVVLGGGDGGQDRGGDGVKVLV